MASTGVRVLGTLVGQARHQIDTVESTRNVRRQTEIRLRRQNRVGVVDLVSDGEYEYNLFVTRQIAISSAISDQCIET